MWLQAHDIVVRARHIPGCLNVIADHLSCPNQPTQQRSLHPEIVSRIFRFWGIPVVDMFNCHCLKLPSSSVHVSNSRATSAGGGCSVSRLAGKVDVHVHVSTFSLAQQSYSETTVHTEAEVILIAPWWPKQSWFPHLLRIFCGSSTILSIPPRSPVLTGPEIRLGLKVAPSARMEALVRHYKAAGFSDEV